MAGSGHVTGSITVRERWWLRHYIAAVMVAAHITGSEPDAQQVGRWVRRGLVVKVVPNRGTLRA